MAGFFIKLLELLEESVIVSGMIALGTVSTILYLCIKGAPIPDVLINIGMIVIGFFFGGKVQAAQSKTQQSYVEYASRMKEVQNGRPEKSE